jgi:DNA-binding MarR family transcriptional regulator
LAGPAAPPPPSPAVVLVAAGRRAQQALDAALAELGLSMRHLGALGHLSRHQDLSISDLARRSGITPQSMHTTINDLEALGALDRTVGGRGRRAELTVTAEGHRLLEAGKAAVDTVDERLQADLGPLDAEVLARLVRFGFASDG